MRKLAFLLVLVPAVAVWVYGCDEQTPTENVAVTSDEASFDFEGTRRGLSSTFDADTDGWTIYGDAEGALGTSAGIQIYPEYDFSGGTPGGAVFADDDMRGSFWYWQAPPKFLGNRLGTYGGRLEFDLKQSLIDQQNHWADAVLAGAGMTLVINAYPLDPATGTSFGNPGLAWTHYSIALIEGAGWKHQHQDFGADATAAEIRLVLKDLVALRIRGEFRSGPDRCGLDNVRFLPPGQGR